MSLTTLLDLWRRDPLTAPNFAAWRTLPARPAATLPLPDDLPAPVQQALIASGIHSLYSHQAAAWTHVRNGENILLATGTASGKTLAYNLPVFATLLEDPNARALYLFPTKALAQDQLSVIRKQLSVISRHGNTHTSTQVDDGTYHPVAQRSGRNISSRSAAEWTDNAAIYDGDTPPSHRPAIRKTARLVLTNPDMLHMGILPHHTNWDEFFAHLKFIVIDEAHTYRGVFGSHVANVLRRLQRVAKFYGASPQFMLASATIGNPRELAEKLIEAPVHLIDEDGSARTCLPRQACENDA